MSAVLLGHNESRREETGFIVKLNVECHISKTKAILCILCQPVYWAMISETESGFANKI